MADKKSDDNQDDELKRLNSQIDFDDLDKKLNDHSNAKDSDPKEKEIDEAKKASKNADRFRSLKRLARKRKNGETDVMNPADHKKALIYLGAILLVLLILIIWGSHSVRQSENAYGISSPKISKTASTPKKQSTSNVNSQISNPKNTREKLLNISSIQGDLNNNYINLKNDIIDFGDGSLNKTDLFNEANSLTKAAANNMSNLSPNDSKVNNYGTLYNDLDEQTNNFSSLVDNLKAESSTGSMVKTYNQFSIKQNSYNQTFLSDMQNTLKQNKIHYTITQNNNVNF